MSKIGRNQPCPCGSGKKYKRCHGALTAKPQVSSRDRDREIQLAMMRHEAKLKEIERQFGSGRPPISFDFGDHKFVAVGSEIHWSKTWKSFPDFLMSYFKKVMGQVWGEAQLAKSRDQWDPLFLWYVKACELQQRTIPTPDKMVQIGMTGAVAGIFWLTYGLYLLRHNAEIQDRLLQRLRSSDPVQVFGAVYEVQIASALIWSGFKLELEDETDGSRTHCEFVATSKQTGKRYAVEVKVCAPGNFQRVDAKSRTVRQLIGALSKEAAHPRIVCIDVNRPVAANVTAAQYGELMEREAGLIRAQERNLKVGDDPAPPAYVILTNFPVGFDLDGAGPTRAALIEGFKIPRLTTSAKFNSLQELSEFNSEHADPIRLTNALAMMTLPQTLDGSLPGQAFGQPLEVERLLIGGEYVVKDTNGNDVPGILESAVVDEGQSSVFGIFRLGDGSYVKNIVPILSSELAIYRDSPETFFGKYEPRNKVEHPVELYEFILSSYKSTPKEKLLDFMKGHPQLEALAKMEQAELAKFYANACAERAVVSQNSRYVVPR